MYALQLEAIRPVAEVPFIIFRLLAEHYAQRILRLILLGVKQEFANVKNMYQYCKGLC
ncbi:MAG: hypothetical protein QW056_05570 [Candidatus Bathyarchaeia archaeon]